MFLTNTALHSRLIQAARVPCLSYPKNTTGNLLATENAEISDDFWKRRTRLYSSYYKRAFFIKALKYRRFGNDIVQSVSVVFHGAFRWLFSYNQKPFVRRRLRRYRLRHKIRAIKTRPNNPLRFLQRKKYLLRFVKRFGLASFSKRRSEQENIFTTNNTRPNQKVNRLNQSALFLAQGLTTAALQCTVKPLFFFFLTKSQPFNKKLPKSTIISINLKISQEIQ